MSKWHTELINLTTGDDYGCRELILWAERDPSLINLSKEWNYFNHDTIVTISFIQGRFDMNISINDIGCVLYKDDAYFAMEKLVPLKFHISHNQQWVLFSVATFTKFSSANKCQSIQKITFVEEKCDCGAESTYGKNCTTHSSWCGKAGEV